MQIPLLTVVTMILILVSAFGESTFLRGGSHGTTINRSNRDLQDGEEGGTNNFITYGEPYYLQLVSGNRNLNYKHWLTNSRKLNESDEPSTGTGNYVWTEDGASLGSMGIGEEYIVDPNQYRWVIGSSPSDGSRLDENGQVIWEDPKRNEECMRYGDLIYVQGLGKDNHWLASERGNSNIAVNMASSAQEGKWYLRSAAVRNRNDPDPLDKQCVRFKDQVFFQASNVDDRYLTGELYSNSLDVFTWGTDRASQFELQSSVDLTGPTLNPVGPSSQPSVSPSSQSTFTPSESPSSKPSDSPSSNEDTIDSLRATIADLAATVISLEESIVQKDSIIADLSFRLDANCVPIDPTPSPTPPTDTPSIAPTKALTSAQSLTPTNAPTLVPSATSTVAPWTSYRRTSCEGTKATIRSISGNYRPKVLSNCKSTCEYYDECVGFNYWDDNEVQTTECVFYSDITATPAKSYESEGRQDYITSYCYVQSHKLLSLSSSSGINKYEREGWSRILASDPISESSTTDIDSTISILFDWKDQGHGNRKGKVRVLLLSEDGTIVAQKIYQKAPHNWETREEILNLDQDLVNLARVGYSYAVEVMAGWGGGHVLYVRDFELKTNFAFV